MATNGLGRGFNKNWNPMQDDFENSTHDLQIPGDNNSGGDLDYCRLYLRNIPEKLDTNGLHVLFSKFGNLCETFINADQHKKFGLVRFETPGEAKHAMTTLNKTPPLFLNIVIAKANRNKVKSNFQKRKNFPRDKQNDKELLSNSFESNDNSLSGSSKNLIRRNMDNGDADMYLEDDALYDDDHLNLEIEHLRYIESQCRYKRALKLSGIRNMAPSVTPGNRYMNADGMIVVRNAIEDRSTRYYNMSRISGSTDIHEISDVDNGGISSDAPPPLFHISSRPCVQCGAEASSFCSRCLVTPYCSVSCQRTDWNKRHSAVCHNLASTPHIPQLRRPKSPASQPVKKNNARATNNDDSYLNKTSTVPPTGHVVEPKRNDSNKFNYRNRPDNNRPNNNYEKYGNQSGFKGRRDPGQRPPLQHDDKQKSDKDAKWDGGEKNKVVEIVEVAEPPKGEETVKSVKEESRAVTDVKPVKEKPQAVAPKCESVKAETPKKYLPELVEIDDTFRISVDRLAPDCRTDGVNFVCVSVNEDHQLSYMKLCIDYSIACNNDKTTDFKPSVGQMFSVLNPEDGAWYRARMLAPSVAALVDDAKLLNLTADAVSKPLDDEYGVIPEFSCCLTCPKATVGIQLQCKVLSKSFDQVKVLLEENASPFGEGVITRWRPVIDVPKAITPVTPAAQVAILEPDRPELIDGSEVLLVDVTSFDRLFVQPADMTLRRDYDMLINDVASYGQKASPLVEPPQKGQLVIAKFTDGIHYRALVTRTSVKLNKYLLEYIEFGNIQTSTLECLYPCPSELNLNSRPILASRAKLTGINTSLTPDALEYLNTLKDDVVTLKLKLPDGSKAPSGGEVELIVVKNNENVNRKVAELTTPDWKKLEKQGVDVLKTDILMLSDVSYVKLPEGGCTLQVLDASLLENGLIFACDSADPNITKVLSDLSEKIAEYCKSEMGKEPYLPRCEELCIAKCPPHDEWYRAVMCEQGDGPGGQLASVMYLDYGNMSEVPVKDIRKMLPEFMKYAPVLGCSVEIKDFPKKPKPEALAKAKEFMGITEEDSSGKLTVRCSATSDEWNYIVEAPELISAMQPFL